jgi:hypothetical protein
MGSPPDDAGNRWLVGNHPTDAPGTMPGNPAPNMLHPSPHVRPLMTIASGGAPCPTTPLHHSVDGDKRGGRQLHGRGSLLVALVVVRSDRAAPISSVVASTAYKNRFGSARVALSRSALALADRGDVARRPRQAASPAIGNLSRPPLKSCSAYHKKQGESSSCGSPSFLPRIDMWLLILALIPSSPDFPLRPGKGLGRKAAHLALPGCTDPLPPAEVPPRAVDVRG